ncbi:MAG: hypothetical protein HDT21_09880, partial [Ruminococcus sp.]|nr:hypothetical protein [Ruminococcus sp.]
HRFGRYAPAGARGDFALCGARPKGSALWTSASWAQLDQLHMGLFILLVFFTFYR